MNMKKLVNNSLFQVFVLGIIGAFMVENLGLDNTLVVFLSVIIVKLFEIDY